MILFECWSHHKGWYYLIILSTALTLVSVCLVPSSKAVGQKSIAEVFKHCPHLLATLLYTFLIKHERVQLETITHLTHSHTNIFSGCCYPIYFYSILSTSLHLNYSGGRSGGSDNSDCDANLLTCLTTALAGCNWHNCQVRVRKTKAIWMWRDKDWGSGSSAMDDVRK